MHVTNQKPQPRKAKVLSTLDRLVERFAPAHTVDQTTPYTDADLKAHPGANPNAIGYRRFNGQRWRRVKGRDAVTLFDLGRWLPHQGLQEAARRRRRAQAHV